MSIFTRQPLRLPLVHWHQIQPHPEARQTPATRDFDCTFCGATLRVALRAINTRCTNCHKHLRLEDVVIRGDSPLTRIITCGSILVEPSARFSGVLQGTDVVIAGRVMGTVIGTQRVQVTATGKIAGTIATRDLACDPAALIDGQVNILNPDGSISSMTTGADRAPPKYRPGE